MSAASSGVIVGKASYILVGAIIGVRTSGMWMVVMCDAVVDHLGGDAARQGVERRLRGHVGREARRVGLHADRADVDDVAALAALARLRIAGSRLRISRSAPK